ncbi:hypothetical protein JRI60_41255 [Archangium violaceum]|uniref:hypothetical protein n=1 Tax=Archangium violaceum TaxID=83451 RepID=UPI001950DED3|nr:hypothetical protein [Archangium violaceum]QRN95433.1 hypothetical protein JRI60_41255 [Archangium violaceum]
MTARKTLTERLDEKLDQVLKNPRGWGGVDVLEPLVLMLLILRAETADPPVSHAEVLRRYRRFLAERVAPGAGDIRARLGEALSLEAVVDVLREHVDAVREREVSPPLGKGSVSEALPDQGSTRRFPAFGSVEVLH